MNNSRFGVLMPWRRSILDMALYKVFPTNCYQLLCFPEIWQDLAQK